MQSIARAGEFRLLTFLARRAIIERMCPIFEVLQESGIKTAKTLAKAMRRGVRGASDRTYIRKLV